MTIKRIVGITVIFTGTAIAWMILGGVNVARTSSSFSSLKGSIKSLYGGNVSIEAPTLYFRKPIAAPQVRNKEDKYTSVYSQLDRSKIEIDVRLDRRKKGNLWFPTFKTHFSGSYHFEIDDFNPNEQYYLHAPLTSTDSVYSNIKVEINGEPFDKIAALIEKNSLPITPRNNGTVDFSIQYDVSGMEELSYLITPGYDEIGQIKNFECTMKTNFLDYDFPTSKLSPTEKKETDNSAELYWNFDNTITGKDIGLIIPNKLNAGDIIPRVAFFAPISLLFFFVVLLMISVVYQQNLHPMHFFFLALTFFSFHLMFSYFSDKLDIYVSFVLASVISLGLTVSYLGRFLSKMMSYVIAPLTQLIYLVVFSFSFFFDGMTGLIVTICAVLTLFALMQITAKIQWDSVFGENT